MIRAWRIVKTRYASTAFNGEGAKRSGGRWNSPGTAIVYTAGTRSLALLEMLVHIETPELLPFYSFVGCDIPDALITPVAIEDLPERWRSSPPPPETQSVGDAWVTGATSAVLAVPSVIVPSETNYLLNPAHRQFPEIVISASEPFDLDERLASGTRRKDSSL